MKQRYNLQVFFGGEHAGAIAPGEHDDGSHLGVALHVQPLVSDGEQP